MVAHGNVCDVWWRMVTNVKVWWDMVAYGGVRYVY